MTGGDDHIVFWSVHAKNLTAFKGVFAEDAKAQTLTCGVALEGVATELGPAVVTGTISGALYIWTSPSAVRMVPAHARYTTFSSLPSSSGLHPHILAQLTHIVVIACRAVSAIAGDGMGGCVTGGYDGFIKLWDGEMGPTMEFNLGAEAVPVPLKSAISSLAVDGSFTKILATTMSSDVYEVVRDSRVACRLLTGHFGKTACAPAKHPVDGDLYVTGSDDETVRLWSSAQSLELSFCQIGAPVQALSWTADGSMVIAGLGTSEVIGITVDVATGEMSKTKIFVKALPTPPQDVKLSTG